MSIDSIRKMADDLNTALKNYNPTTTTPPTTQPPATPPPTTADKIHVAASNIKQICTNLDAIDFSGSTTSRVRMTSGHCNMEIPNKYVNPRMIYKGKIIKGVSPYWLQLKQKGGSHTNSNPCPGCAYMLRVQDDGTITFNKELEHLPSPASGYCNNRRDTLPGTAKKVVLNTEQTIELRCTNVDSGVKLEAYVDGIFSGSYTDKGDWSNSDPSFKTDCDSRQLSNTGFRKRNELLQKAGEKSILRIDGGTILDFEYIDVINA